MQRVRVAGSRINEVFPETLISNGGLTLWDGGAAFPDADYGDEVADDWYVIKAPLTCVVSVYKELVTLRYANGVGARVNFTGPGGAGPVEGGIKAEPPDPQRRECQTYYVTFSAWVKVEAGYEDYVVLKLYDYSGGSAEEVYSNPHSSSEWDVDVDDSDWKFMSVTKEVRDGLADNGTGDLLYGAVVAYITDPAHTSDSFDFYVDDAVFVRGYYPQGADKIPDPDLAVSYIYDVTTITQQIVGNAIVDGYDDTVTIHPGTSGSVVEDNRIFNVVTPIAVDINSIGANGRQNDGQPGPSTDAWYWLYILMTDLGALAGYLVEDGLSFSFPGGAWNKHRRIGAAYVDSSGRLREFVQVGHKVTYEGDPLNWADPAQLSESLQDWVSAAPNTLVYYLSAPLNFTEANARTQMQAIAPVSTVPPFGIPASARFRGVLISSIGLIAWVGSHRLIGDPACGKPYASQAIKFEDTDVLSEYALHTYIFETMVYPTLGFSLGWQRTVDVLAAFAAVYPFVLLCDGYDDPLNHL